jgi:C1A family cysteine protease
MKAVLSLLLGVAYSTSIWQQDRIYNFDEIDHVSAFKDWMYAFNKTYADGKELEHRFLIFLETWKDINFHNLYDGATWQMGHNQFSDLTQQEFEDTILCNTAAMEREWTELQELVGPPPEVDPDAPRADSIDWTKKDGQDWTTPIKNQGSCGSCWAFGATGPLESRWAIKNGISSKVNLAEQEFVDCDKKSNGCSGGFSQNAFTYAASAGGVCLTSTYKYTAKGGSCKASSCGKHYDPTKKGSPYTAIKVDDAKALETATTAGPTSLGVDASTWKSYKSGVYTAKCGAKLNHAVTGVGFGTTTGGDYWKVRNSWGTSFGMQGYILVCRNCNKNGAQGQCGINHHNCYPNLG